MPTTRITGNRNLRIIDMVAQYQIVDSKRFPYSGQRGAFLVDSNFSVIVQE